MAVEDDAEDTEVAADVAGAQLERTVSYPLRWEADIVLRDGATVHLRPITPEDGASLQRFHESQSAESQYLRFFSPMPHLSDKDIHRFTHVDHHGRVAFVATLGDDIVGVGRYERLDDGSSAEVAFNISDVHQGRGLGSILLEHLGAAARENGIRQFVAEVLPRNQKMLVVFKQAGYEVSSHFEDGVVSLHFDIDPTEKSLAVVESREHRAEARSVEALLNPGSVAMIGASRRPGTVGHRLLSDLIAGDFSGELFVVHPKAGQVLGLRTVRRMADLPQRVDLAVVAVPAENVLDVVRECAVAGVRGLVVVSSGFAETGPRGLARQRELVRVARANGLRVVGPNSWGMINADPAVRLNVSMGAELPAQGRLGLFSQSGGLSVAVLDAVSRRGLGVSTFLSAGNRADVSGNDCMQYWEEDPKTDVVAMYMESIGNPRKFSRIARRLARTKPVIVLKSGASGYGVPPGHSVRASTVPREAFDAMLRQSGCIRVETLNHMLDVTQLLLHQPLPAGNRVGIVGNSDALGTLIADACSSWQLQVQHEPVSLHPQAGAEEFRRALKQMFAQPDVDAVVAAFIPPIATDADRVAQVLSDIASKHPIPVVACFLGASGVTAALSSPRVIPSYPTPEEAVRALAAATRYADWRRRDPGHRVEPPGVDIAAARDVVHRSLAGQVSVQLTTAQIGELLATIGVELWTQIPVADADAALAAAEQVGFPVVLKTTNPVFRHRVDLGGVRLNIDDSADLRHDYEQMRTQFGSAADELVIQRMAEPGVACVVRSVEDPLFGPVVSFGLGGDASTLLGDIAHRIPPLTDVDVSDLVRSVRAAPKLFGHYGAAPVDVPALEDIIARVSALADEVPEVAELELNPIVVRPGGLSVLGADVRLALPAERSDTGRRGLSSDPQ